MVSIPEVLEKLVKEKALPTQLYVSVEAPTEEIHKKINSPLIKNSWKRLNKTLEIIAKLPCRRVIRMTIIKSLNDSNIDKWAKLIKKAAGTGKAKYPFNG